MAFDGTLKFDTALDQSGFKAGLEGLGGIAKAGMAAVTGAVTAAVGAVSALGVKAIDVGKQFEGSFAQLQTIMDTSVVSVSDMSEALRGLSSEMGVSAAELSLTAYNAISATGDTAGAMDIVTNASKLAVAGFTDSASALSTLTTVMNAYGMTAEETAQISDSLIMVQNLGVTTVSELSASMGKAIATASAYGVDLYNLESAYVSLTKAGISTAESTTYIGSMFKELGSSGSAVSLILQERTGKSFGELMADGKTLGDVLGVLSDSVDGDANALMNLWSSAEAGKASNALLSQGLSTFNDNLETIQGSAGATETAFKKMAGTLEFKINQLKESGTNLLVGIYDEMQPALTGLAELGMQSISKLSDAFQAGGFEGLAKSLGGVLGQAVSKISSYVPDIVKLGVSLVSSLADGLAQNAPAIAKAGLSAGLTLVEGIFSVSADMLSLGASLLVTLADSIRQRLPRIKRIAKSILKEMTASLSENLPLLLTAGAEIIGMLAGVLIDNLPLVVASALKIVKSLCDTLLTGDNLQKLLDAGLQLLMSVTQAVVDNLPLLIDIALQIVRFLCTELLSSENMLALVDAAGQILVTLVDAINENIDEVLLAAEEILRTLGTELTKPENLKQLVEIGTELLAELIVGLCEIGGQLVGFALVVFGELGNALDEMDWGSLGIAIVEGICSGLLDCDFILDEYLRDFKDNWITGFKDIFGIHSPSKLMEEVVGKNLALGIGVGFTEEMPDVGRDAAEAFAPLQQSVDAGALSAFRAHSLTADAGIAAPSATSEITNNHYSYSTVSQAADNRQSGQIAFSPTVYVQIGNEEIRGFVVSVIDDENAVTGGNAF